MNNVAIILDDQSKLEEVAATQKDVLKKSTRISRREYSETVTAMGDLANTVGNWGKLKEEHSHAQEIGQARDSFR
jgi:hypothetical protein